MPTAPILPSTASATLSTARVADMQPGQQFIPAGDICSVYALLTHKQVPATDAVQRWCVVVASKGDDAHLPGELRAFDSDARVYPVTVRHPAVYSTAG